MSAADDACKVMREAAAEIVKLRAERDEAIEALRKLEPFGKSDRAEVANPGRAYWQVRHQLLRAAIRKACAILAKHPPKVPA